MKKVSHIPDLKKKMVKDLEELALKYPVVALVDLTNMPSPQLQKMRQSLRKNVFIYVVKKRMIGFALKNISSEKQGIEKLYNLTQNTIPALLFTSNNPFKLFKDIKKSKTVAAAKPGQIAPKDIVIPEGPTPFAPGPIIGELGQFGIKTAVEAGKIAVKQEKIIVKEGEVIKDAVAALMGKFNMKPIEIGLNLVAAYEEGIIYDKKTLDVDETAYLNMLTSAHLDSVKLAYATGYPTPETLKLLVSKLHRESLTLSIELNITNDATIKFLLAKAEIEAGSLPQTE